MTVVPEAVSLWDYKQNNILELDPTKLLPHSDKRAHFVCTNGHDEYRKINDFTKSPKCQACSRSLVINAPKTAQFLNVNKNTLEDILDYFKSNLRPIELHCPNCLYSWSWRGKLWCERQYCPHCGYDGTEGSCERNSFVKDLFHITTLRDANPEAASIWDYEKNGESTPDNVIYGSDSKYAFKCSNNHEFTTSLISISSKKDKSFKCPLCNGAKKIIISGINDVVSSVPEIIEFWDYSKNEKDPTTLSKKSGYLANFKCNKGHKFSRKVYLFTISPGCLDCKKIEILKNISIQYARPSSYKFWDFNKNTLDPSVTSIYSKEEAYWKCDVCEYEWKQRISDRCSTRTDKCPSHDFRRKFNSVNNLAYEESFAYKNPAASLLWNIEYSNGLTPYNTPKCSNKKIYMNCSRENMRPI